MDDTKQKARTQDAREQERERREAERSRAFNPAESDFNPYDGGSFFDHSDGE